MSVSPWRASPSMMRSPETTRMSEPVSLEQEEVRQKDPRRRVPPVRHFSEGICGSQLFLARHSHHLEPARKVQEPPPTLPDSQPVLLRQPGDLRPGRVLHHHQGLGETVGLQHVQGVPGHWLVTATRTICDILADDSFE